jgi:hypothetical protein
MMLPEQLIEELMRQVNHWRLSVKHPSRRLRGLHPRRMRPVEKLKMRSCRAVVRDGTLQFTRRDEGPSRKVVNCVSKLAD